MDVLELLLSKEKPKLPEKDIKLKRLSKEFGSDVIIKIRALEYEVAREIQSIHKDDMEVHIILAGVVEPLFKNQELMRRYNAEIPSELIKKMLLIGEITDISRDIERLSGYRIDTIEDVVKKN